MWGLRPPFSSAAARPPGPVSRLKKRKRRNKTVISIFNDACWQAESQASYSRIKEGGFSFLSIHHLFLEEGVYEENTSPATKKLKSRREAWFSLLAETQVNRLLLPNPYSFLRGGAGEPFFGLQRTVPPQYIHSVFTVPFLYSVS